MISNDAHASTPVQLLVPGAKADTAAATSSYVALAAYENKVLIIQSIGTVTAGQIAGKIQHADDGSGTNVADLSGATFTAITTSTDPAIQKIVIPVAGCKPYIRYVGTITTGPVDASVTLLAAPKYVWRAAAMAFVEDFAPYFADFGVAGTLAGTAVRGLLDVETVDDFGVVTQTTSYLMEPTTAVTPAVGQALVADGVTYTVRQVQLEPPDGALRRLVLTRA